MDLIDLLQDLSRRIEKQIGMIDTEEATKHAFVLPFIQTLGYDVFNPSEIVPEFVADVGTKKGEKVDYAILNAEGVPTIIIECKAAGIPLDVKKAGQLFRYFAVTPVRIGILTDGIRYKLYSDIDRPNIMDEHPFLEFDMRNIRPAVVAEIKKLTKANFEVERIVGAAARLKYIRQVQTVFERQLVEPEEDLVKFFAALVAPEKRFTKAFKEEFTPLVQEGLKTFVSRRVEHRLETARNLEEGTPISFVEDEEPEQPKIVTTQDEWEGFYLVKNILRDAVDPTRITMRDTKSYCGILLDDNNRKPICRLHFNNLAKKKVGIFDREKQETRHEISALEDIYAFADGLRDVVTGYDLVENPESPVAPSEE